MSGVSIVTCTHLPNYRDNIFSNYSRQTFNRKELILILNSSALDMYDWQRYATVYPNVLIYFKPENVTVGTCMNFAISQTRYDYIANFDHDDYYGAEYLNDFMSVAPYTNAGLFGKKTHYVYFEEDETLALMHDGYENCFVDYVDGPTMFMKKSIFNKVRFIDNSISDCRLSWDCRSRGIKIYSVNKKHFAYIRKGDLNLHTWKLGNNEILNTYCNAVGKVKDYKTYVDTL